MPEEAPVMRVRRGDMGGDFRAAIDGRDRDTRGTKNGRGGGQKGEAAKDGRDKDTRGTKNGRDGRQKRGGQGWPRQGHESGQDGVARGGGEKRKIHPACGEGWIMMGMDVIT